MFCLRTLREIKLLRHFHHENIIAILDILRPPSLEQFTEVYLVQELMETDMHRVIRTQDLSDDHAQYFIYQTLRALNALHSADVIHRDLKLGNIFLDSNMNVKVGDFGLAALIENPGERKKTICGTPNYIAPEVLFDTANGHSFEVDTWSIGVILYTLVVGRPPFQTKDVKAIYK